MYRDYGKVYKVVIEFNNRLINTEEIKAFFKAIIERELFNEEMIDKENYEGELKILSLKGNRLKLLWGIPDNEGVHEIETSWYYILEDYKYGTYTCEFVR